MSKTTIEAVFDGEVLRPSTQLDLPVDSRVTITVHSPSTVEEPRSFLETALSLSLQGPPDWSENVDRYLSETRNASNG